MIFNADSSLFEYGHRCMAVFECDVVLPGIDPKQAERFSGGAVLRDNRLFLFFMYVGEPAELKTPTYAKSAELVRAIVRVCTPPMDSPAMAR